MTAGWVQGAPLLSVCRGEGGAGSAWLDLTDGAGYLVGPGAQGFDAPDSTLFGSTLPGQDGELPRGGRVEPRQVFVPLDVHGAAGPAFRARLRALYRVFNPRPDRGAAEALVTLRSVNDAGEARQITGRPSVVSPSGDDARGYGGDGEQFAVIGLSLRCPSPWWTDATPTVLTFQTDQSMRKQLVASGSFFPVRLSQSSILGGSGLAIDGDVDTYPVWTVRGPGAGLVVRSETLGQQWAISGSIGADQTVTVDCRRPGRQRAVDQNGVNLWPRMVGSVLWPLVVGDNALTVQFANAGRGSFISLSYRRQLLDAAL